MTVSGRHCVQGPALHTGLVLLCVYVNTAAAAAADEDA